MPLTLLGSISYACQSYLGGRTATNEQAARRLLPVDEQHRCAERRSSARPALTWLGDCLRVQDGPSVGAPSSTTLILRSTNESNARHLLRAIFDETERALHSSGCLRSNRTVVRLWNERLDRDERTVALDTSTVRNVIVDIRRLSSNVFHYDIVVQMPVDEATREKLVDRVDRSFLRRHEHPAEQFVRDRRARRARRLPAVSRLGPVSNTFPTVDERQGAARFCGTRRLQS
jgi:hypothetical protein